MKKLIFTLSVLFSSLYFCTVSASNGNPFPSSTSQGPSFRSGVVPTEQFYDSIALPYSVDSLAIDSSKTAKYIYMSAISQSYPAVGFKVTLTSADSLHFLLTSNEISSSLYAVIVSKNVDLSTDVYMNISAGSTAALAAGVYYIAFFTDNLYGKANIFITSTDVVTSISEATDNNFLVYGDNKAIVISGIKSGSNLSVFSADGSLITSAITNSNIKKIGVPVAGLYIVKVNGITKKVFVK
ncbi:MAG: hypothetical protein P4L28_01855 [Paludibacteraceae bacterium]|nr:hypothetical protein [Paludibacteraceae bacterium]